VTENREPSRSALVWLSLVPVAILLYLASVGPVARIVRTSGLERSSIPGTVISIVYWPVEALANEVPLFGELLRWYIDLYVP
jgi:hypothetical protein